MARRLCCSSAWPGLHLPPYPCSCLSLFLSLLSVSSNSALSLALSLRRSALLVALRLPTAARTKTAAPRALCFVCRRQSHFRLLRVALLSNGASSPCVRVCGWLHYISLQKHVGILRSSACAGASECAYVRVCVTVSLCVCVCVCVRLSIAGLLLACCLLLLVHLKLRARTVRLAVRARRFCRRLARLFPSCISSSRYVCVCASVWAGAHLLALTAARV